MGKDNDPNKPAQEPLGKAKEKGSKGAGAAIAANYDLAEQLNNSRDLDGFAPMPGGLRKRSFRLPDGSDERIFLLDKIAGTSFGLMSRGVFISPSKGLVTGDLPPYEVDLLKSKLKEYGLDY